MLIVDISKHIKTPIRGAIHIGAHHAEESVWYTQNNITPVVWIECNPNYASIIKAKIQPDDTTITACISNKNENTIFNIANNGESSSLLQLNRHKILHPDIHYIDSAIVNTMRMVDIYKQYNINSTQYNFLNLDIQGYELEAMKSFENLILSFDYIYTEINTTHVYDSCALVTEIDDYLLPYGFTRQETKMYNEWGDALYTKHK